MGKRVFGVQIVGHRGVRKLIVWGRTDRGQKTVLDAVVLPTDGSSKEGMKARALEAIARAQE